MTEVTATDLEAALAEARERMEAVRRIVLTTHVQPDGDGIGSQVALARFLRERGKEVTILNPHRTARRYRFLEPDPPIVPIDNEIDATATLSRAELLVVMDIAVPDRLGRLDPIVRRREPPTVVIDHHRGPSMIPGVDVRDETAAATGEIVWRLLTGWDRAGVTPEIATALYAAIAYDTGGFRYSNTSATTHEIAAELIRAGADLAAVQGNLFESDTEAHARLVARVLGTFERSDDGRVAWAAVSMAVLDELGATGDDIDGIVESLRAIDGVEVALLFKEVDREATKASLRSSGDQDVQSFAARFGGGGHKNASGIYFDSPLDRVVERVVPAAVETFSRDADEPERPGR